MPAALQMKLSLRGISPLIWRRLVMPSEMTLADLHKAIQLSMNWDDDFMYAFRIHVREYSTTDQHAEENAAEHALKDLPISFKECFLYTYNYFSFWEFDVRIEKALTVEANKNYPRLLAGSGDPPPENIGGPVLYLQWLDQQYSMHNKEAIYTLNETMQPLLRAIINKDETKFLEAAKSFNENRELLEEATDQLEGTVWTDYCDYDRKAINQALKQAFQKVAP